MSNLQPYYNFKLDFQKVDQHDTNNLRTKGDVGGPGVG